MVNESDIITLAVLKNDLTYIKDKVNIIENKLENNSATKEELLVVKDALEKRVAFLEKIVFGFITLILIAVTGTWIGLVLIKPHA